MRVQATVPPRTNGQDTGAGRAWRRPYAPAPVLAALFCVLCAASMAAGAGTVQDILKRKELRCGVSEGIPGFSQQDASGQWVGLDVDLCRAIAAAVLDDPMRVRLVPLKASYRFPALKEQRVDLLARNTTWSMTREVLLGVSFPGVWFYDGQAFMVPASAAITALSGLDGARVCVEKGTTHEANLLRHFAAHGLRATVVVIDSADAAAAALFAGKCAAYSSDAAQLVALRLQAPAGAQSYLILPERISKEPLGPVVRDDDRQWASLVRWVLYALIAAEERGITRANAQDTVPAMLALLGAAPRARADWDYAARALGLPPEWALRAVAAVGNYGEIFERNLGSGSALRLERGQNHLWLDGGLMYAPPLN